MNSTIVLQICNVKFLNRNYTGWYLFSYMFYTHFYTQMRPIINGGLKNVIPYSQKYWWEFYLAVESQIPLINILEGFKFGGSVQDHHKYNVTIILFNEEILIW